MLGAIALCFTACSKDDGDHGHDAPGQMMPNAGEPSAQLYIHVEGKAIGGEASPLANAGIYLSEHSGTEEAHHHHAPGEPNAVTDANGDVVVDLVPDKAYVVHIEAAGFDGLVRLVQEPESNDRHLWLTLNEEQRTTVDIPEEGEVSVTLGTTSGGTVNPVTLTIEAGDLGASNGDGDSIAGAIEITFGSWDPAVDDASSLPSDLLTADGPLVSYGMFHIEFEQNGEVLNVRPDQTIAWTMQVNEAMQSMATQAAAMDTLNIYSLDHNSGLWVEDDVSKTYAEETGVVTTESRHFSHKNVDQPGPFPASSCIDIQVVDERGNSINADIAIQGRGAAQRGCNEIACTIDGQAGQVGYTATARRHVVNGRWVSGEASVNTTCDDINVGCGTPASCSAARIALNLCHLDDEPCQDRDQCCDDGQDRACLFANGPDAGVCGQCVPEGQTCRNSNECCNGLSCSDFQCFAN